jgi:glycosyltransferase involved in cell wall biosynthesis
VARGLDRAQIAVSHCGLDHGRYRPGPEKTPHPSVLFVGRLRRYKGVDTLLEAFARLRPRLPEARLTVLGDGPHRAALEERARRLRLGDAVEFTGFLPPAEKVRRLAEAWVSALPSPKEGWGLTVVESNACGTPVVASRSPGLVDSVRDGESGLLVPHGDADALAGALARVLGDAPLRERLRAGGLAWARRFSWERCSDEAWTVAGAVARGLPLPDPAARAAGDQDSRPGEDAPAARQRTA